MTVEELLEIERIKQLRVLYSHYFDGRDIDKLSSLFTEDAVCEFGPAYGGDWVGRKTITDNYRKYAEGEDRRTPFGFMHATTNSWVRLLSPDTANGRHYLIDLNVTVGVENPIILFGIYDDVYKKVRGNWLIHRTRIDFLWPRREYVGYRSTF